MADADIAAIRYALERHGFRPMRSAGAFIEFSKLYADGEGRVTRAVIRLERGRLDMGGTDVLRLAHFVIEARTLLGPSEAEVACAPLVARGDLRAVLQDLSTCAAPLPVILCTSCGASVSTYGAQGFCLDCEVTHA